VSLAATSGNKRYTLQLHFERYGPIDDSYTPEIASVACEVISRPEFHHGRVFSVHCEKRIAVVVFTWNPNDRDITTKPKWWQKDRGWKYWNAFEKSQVETEDQGEEEGVPSAPGGPGT